MSFRTQRIADPQFVAENRVPAHADHRWFRDAVQAATGVSSFEQSLNGVWKVQVSDGPTAAPAGFEAPAFDVAGWEDIPVPSHLQLHGHGRPHYANVQYPWDGLESLAAGEVPAANLTASYVRDFTLEEPLATGERLAITFHGAESGVAVWINGDYVGWSTDSFTPAEFDITAYVRDGVNRVAARVFTWTAGSWLEDQDFFRFSGLFRDVTLYRKPPVHLEDLRVTTALTGPGAQVRVDVTLAGEGSVSATLNGVALEGEGPLVATLAQPHLWSTEDPYLYELLLEVRDANGDVTEVVRQGVGLRSVQIVDGVLLVNGERVVFRGVNRHEFGRRGRVMTAAEIEEDIRIIKRAGINAVRTSHYPNASVFYELCDRYGLLVIDEMNLETHAMWDRLVLEGLPDTEAFPGDRPHWRAALMDRARSMLERDKNHPSVIIWSCGNESYGGGLLHEVSAYFRSADPSRPVHYEGVHWDPRYPDTTDITSQMYTPVAAIEEHLATHTDKPFILCEFAHSMGNSFGAVDKYLDLADREPHFQGGFIWDFADQALPLTDRHGRAFDGYGGDFGDAPSDYDFSANGIVFADRTPKPAYEEVRYLYQPFRTRIARDHLEITSRRQFVGTDDVIAAVELARDGEVCSSAEFFIDVPPGGVREYPLPFAVPDAPGEFAVTVTYRLRSDTAWATAGYAIGWEQEVVSANGDRNAVPATASGAQEPVREPVRVAEGIHNIGVHGERFSALFSRLYGTLVSYRYGTGRDALVEVLRERPFPTFWHAPTSNERGWGMPYRDGQWLLASRARKSPAQQPRVTMLAQGVEVTYTYELPTTPLSTADVTYRVDAEGRVDVVARLRPGAGLDDPPEFGMQFAVDADLRSLTWYGDGPHECYVDRRRGARLGIWSLDVHDALTRYVRPQEAGSRTGVRWAEVVDDAGAGLRFECATGMEFSALPWTPSEIDSALHPNELPPIQRTILRPALARRGVGGDDSWGAMTHPEYRLPTGPLTFAFSFQGVTRGPRRTAP